MKKPRIYELDYIKLLAVFAVFTVHFTVELQYAAVTAQTQIFPTEIFHTYLGSFGVSLFFIASGMALMYIYGESCALKKYYKKRFLNIYPMFWMAFLISTCYHFVLNRGIDHSIPKWKIILSILGIDGNTLWWGMNFYQLGEWFLSVLICMYIIFPLLRTGLNKKPVATSVIVFAAYVVSVLFFKSTLPTDCFFVTRIPEFYFGMVFAKYREKLGAKASILGAAVVAIMAIVPSECISPLVRVPVVGIGTFLALCYPLSKLPQTAFGKNLCQWVSRYNYPFFLTHHVVILSFAALFSGLTLTPAEVWLLYFCCIGVTLLMTRGLYLLNRSFLGLFRYEKEGAR